MEISLKVASPLTAATVKLPDNVPLPGLLLIARVMEFVAVAMKFAPASKTWTLIAGEIETVDTSLLGCAL